PAQGRALVARTLAQREDLFRARTPRRAEPLEYSARAAGAEVVGSGRRDARSVKRIGPLAGYRGVDPRSTPQRLRATWMCCRQAVEVIAQPICRPCSGLSALNATPIEPSWATERAQSPKKISSLLLPSSLWASTSNR